MCEAMINRDCGRARSSIECRRTLVQDAASLGVVLSDGDGQAPVHAVDELRGWNRTYNLTAITSPAAMLTHHLLDSLAIQRDLQGTRIADVGTAPGSGLPLALCNPARPVHPHRL